MSNQQCQTTQGSNSFIFSSVEIVCINAYAIYVDSSWLCCFLFVFLHYSVVTSKISLLKVIKLSGIVSAGIFYGSK